MRAPLIRRPAPAAFLAVLAVLLLTTDERSFGLIPDGQQMLSAAAALSTSGELGVSRDFARAIPREGGDAVSRYGVGLSLVEAIPALAARVLHAVRPAVSTRPLFVLVPVLLLAATAALMAGAFCALSVSPALAALLGVASVLATPLWGYAGSDFSEPLQAAAVAALLFSVLRLRRAGLSARARKAAELLAGLAAGAALLTKSLLILLAAPLLLLALVAQARDAGDKERGRGIRWWVAAAFLPLLILWVGLELARFGRLFGGYPGEGFDYPLLSGVLRLTVYPNKGLLWYAPLLLLVPTGARKLWREDRVLLWACLLPSAALLLAAGAWWAWDGEAGWGPRLLVPAVPPFFVLVAVALRQAGRAARRLGVVLGAAGIAVNLLGALVPFPFVYALASIATPQPMPESRAEGTRAELARGADGILLAYGPRHLALTPAWSPLRLHARILAMRLRGSDVTRGAPDLSPPFLPQPPARPEPGALVEWAANPLVSPDEVLAAASSPFAWPFWGRSWVAPLPGGVDPWRLALRDQAARALDLRRPERAAALASWLLAGGAAPKDIALAAAAALALGKGAEADRLLALSPDACHPWVLFVKAQRDSDLTCLSPAERAGLSAAASRAAREGVSLPQFFRSLRQ